MTIQYAVSVHNGGSSVFNHYPGPPAFAVNRAIARFCEVHPGTTEVFIQLDDGIPGGLARRMRLRLDENNIWIHTS